MTLEAIVARSVTTSTVGPTLATAGLFVLDYKLTIMIITIE